MAKSPTDIRSLARSHGAGIIKTLAGIMNQRKAPYAARVSAAIALADRGWGKAVQPLAGDPDNPVQVVTRIERVIVPAKPDGGDE